MSFDHIWLREGCRCPRCVDPVTKQRNFNMAQIPRNIRPQELRWDGKELQILWKNDIEGYDNHTTTYTREYLNNPVADKIPHTGPSRNRFTWNGEMMDMRQHWVSFDDYMNNDVEFALAMRQLSRLGLIFVKDIPDSREMVEKLATRMGPLRNTFYGPTWDVRSVAEAKNVAYTDKFLEFHMDLLYMNEPPGFQLLHCLQNSCEGGESLFADTFHVVRMMDRFEPEMVKTLSEMHLNYEYVYDNAIYSHTWPVVQNSPLVDDLQHVNYSPPFQAHTGYGKWRKLKRETNDPVGALRFFADQLKLPKNVFELKLEPGQCAIFENRRVVHSRRQFNVKEGQRWLAGAYVDDDAVRSQFRRCGRDMPGVWRNYQEYLEKTNRFSETRSQLVGEHPELEELQEPEELEGQGGLEEQRQTDGVSSQRE